MKFKTTGSGADMHRVLHKPASYEGANETCHIGDWLVAMHHYLMTLKVPATMFVTTASTYLRGEALRFWANRQQTLTSAETRNWEMFKDALLERFDSENTAVSARIKLDQITQDGLTMAKFVQQFDFISSYIPDMADADLIHRFLMAVSPECKAALQNDPSTGVRWTEYVKLRKYALNMYPYATMLEGKTSPQPGSSWGMPSHPQDKCGKGATAGSNKDNMVLGRTYRNAMNKKVLRSQEAFRAILEADVCGFCYRKGHKAGGCTAAHPAPGSPPQAC